MKNKKGRKIFVIGAILLLLILLIVAKKQGFFGEDKNGQEVEIEVVTTQTLHQKVAATGKIQPETEVKISSEVSGEIIELPVKEGQMVKKGDLLVKINPDIYQSVVNRSLAGLETVKASLKQAEASLKESEENYKRNQTLFEKGVISKAEWEKIVSAYNIAKASKESAEHNVKSSMASVSESNDNLKKTTIFSPSNGTISKLSVELGERVVGTIQMTGTEILRVADLTKMEVEVDVNENDIVKISVGNKADIQVDAYLKKSFKGVVTNIANTANSTTSVDQVTNFKVKILIEESSYQDLLAGKDKGYSPFRPGMTATVAIFSQTKENVISVPISAVVIKKMQEIDPNLKGEEAEKRQECVFIFKEGKAVLRAVSTGIQDNSTIEIVSGVEKDEQIITGPYNTVSKVLKNNDEVFKKEKAN